LIEDPGDFRWPAIVIAGFALTGAAPTIFNAMVLFFSTFLRFFGLVIISAAIFLHEILTERDNQGKVDGRWRSIALISAIIGLLFATVGFWAGDHKS